MDITLANFQIKAIADLTEAMEQPNRDIILKSCTGVGCVWLPLKFGNIDISKMLDPRLLGKIYFQQACFYFEEGEKNEL